MDLSEKIMNLRKRSGWSQEELAEQLDISRQSVSKWETGESVPDIDKIIRMSELWGVSTDYLLKEEQSQQFAENGSGEEPPRDERQSTGTRQTARYVSREEAYDFLALSRQAAPRIATGVLLCILSPVCLLLLDVLSEKSRLLGNVALLSENVAGGIGLTVLLVLVAIAVAIFILTVMRLSEYEYMEKELIELPEGVAEELYAAKSDFAVTLRYSITIGVVLCIIGVIPLPLLTIFTREDLFAVVGVCILLVFVAVGVFCMIHAGMINASYDKLLQKGDYTPGKKKMERISGAYWSVIVAIYLFYSFASGNWGISWVIFPVAGVLYGAVSAIVGAIFK